MIQGEVTPDREAVLSLLIRNAGGRTVVVHAVVDTGFTEYISLPPEVIDDLNLAFVYSVPMFLAGEFRAEFDAHTGWIEWDGEWRAVEILKAEGMPLVGMAMLKGFRLTMDAIDGGSLTIARLA